MVHLEDGRKLSSKSVVLDCLKAAVDGKAERYMYIIVRCQRLGDTPSDMASRAAPTSAISGSWDHTMMSDIHISFKQIAI